MPRQSKVSEFSLAPAITEVHDDILSLDIIMKDFLFFKVHHSVQYSTENIPPILLINGVVLVVFQIIE